MSSHIRSANKEDFSRVKEIIDASFPRFYRYFAWHSVSDQSEPTLVNLVYDSVAGFAKLVEFQVDDLKYGCILWIAVHPSFRRRGVASELTQASLERFRADGVRAVFASTQRHNMGALATLGRVGFVRVGILALCRLFGWSVFGFIRDIWLAPGEVVLMYYLYF